jgi:inhibitor of KinA
MNVRLKERRVVRAGDSALMAQFEERVDVGISESVAALGRAVAQAKIAGVRDIVPTFRSLAVYFDPVVTDVDALSKVLQGSSVAPNPAARANVSAVPIRVPVRYGGPDGPDLEAVAEFAGVTPEEVVALHCAREYRVFMLGFVPGFAYLASVDERIAMPRLASPRAHVPAGSVGIAGLQTGIYPSETPGGWRLIGRTAVAPFDPRRKSPFLLQAGDHVQFVAEQA